KRNANRLLTLVNQLLDLSKLEANKMELVLQKGDLKQFLLVTASSFNSLAESKGILFKWNIQLDLVNAWFDSDKLEKIINNILFNAFKFTPQGGTIIYTINLTEDTKDLVLNITDTGKGIPTNEQRHIFSPFYQSQYDGDDQPGTGLGLSLVKELVKLYNGEIDLISAVNQGTSITITLPLTIERLPSSARVTERQPYVTSNMLHTDYAQKETTNPIGAEVEKVKEIKANQDSILVVEDNEDLRNFISSMLQDRFTVLTANNSEEGFTVATENIPDLIISDVMMPKIDGIRLADKLKNDERTSHIPLVLLTAKADIESRIIGLQKGADDYIAKPFSIEELTVRIVNLIEQRKKLAIKYSAELATPTLSVQKELSIDEKFLLRAKQIVEEHISDSSFGVEKMAEKINLSRAQLFRKLKAISGISPNEFINEIRLQKAAHFIHSKADTIAQIGYSVGFNEQSYFAKSFRKRFGVSPSEYSKKEIAEETPTCGKLLQA
ncbi:MAG TPA: ATP-binding protein, partial [Bacteroidia bacterium]|nr:ATP-binding protein [Bacteroidia bacterium]